MTGIHPMGGLAVLAVLALAGSVSAETKADPKKVDAAVDKALAFLKARQNADGSFEPKRGGPGVTGLVIAGLIRHGRADDPVVQKGLKYLESNVQKNGGIYNRGLANYTTAVALMTFKEANTKGQYDAVVANATKFLKGLQNLEGEEDVNYGGVGYDGKGRADLSNTQYFLDALMAAGVSKDDASVQRAVKFISRCQNLPGETNDQPFAAKTTEEDRGGFVYNPSDAKNEKSPNRTPAGGLRSAGVMTYAGLKSFLYAGVSKDDPRVKAATDWIRRNYTLKDNPGQGTSGLYYYYHTFAKAMYTLGDDSFKDHQGTAHDWRAELLDTLTGLQKSDGSWVNSNPAFLENAPELATAYALLALSYCKK